MKGLLLAHPSNSPGYWSYSATVAANETFPNGTRQLPYVDAVIQKAADLGMYVIIDLHAAPGRQQKDAFTGQNPALEPQFFRESNFKRAEQWLAWMTTRIHSTPSYQKAVGMIEVLNEPVTTRDDGGARYNETGQDAGLLPDYYPNALAAVRQKEASLQVSVNNSLHVMFMSKNVSLLTSPCTVRPDMKKVDPGRSTTEPAGCERHADSV